MLAICCHVTFTGSVPRGSKLHHYVIMPPTHAFPKHPQVLHSLSSIPGLYRVELLLSSSLHRVGLLLSRYIAFHISRVSTDTNKSGPNNVLSAFISSVGGREIVYWHISPVLDDRGCFGRVSYNPTPSLGPRWYPSFPRVWCPIVCQLLPRLPAADGRS